MDTATLSTFFAVLALVCLVSVVGVVLGVIAANTGLIRPGFRPGFTFAAKRLLRVGVVLLGLRLSLDQIGAREFDPKQRGIGRGQVGTVAGLVRRL